MERHKVLFVTPSFQSFVVNDIKILETEYEVIVNHYNWTKKKFAPLFFVLQFFTLLRRAFSVHFIVISFGGYWAFWPSLFGKYLKKKVFIILHGTDCASLPEIGYGSLRIPLLKWFCKISYENASKLLPVSGSLAETELRFLPGIKNKFQGFKHHFPTLSTPYQVIHNGLAPDFWKFGPQKSRLPNTFIAVLSQEQFILKGADLILEVAKDLPSCSFFLAGLVKPPHLQIPSNVKFLGKISQKELAAWYQKSTFYFQLSIFEGFGCALVEAMLCGCIPIGSAVNHIPSIIDKYGFVLPTKNKDQLIEIINKGIAMENIEKLSLGARNHVLNNYSLEKRKENLISFFKSEIGY